MILPFSTKIKGKPTRFVEKIIFGLYKNGLISIGKASELLDTPMSIVKVFENQKIHTIREDKNDRWKPGTMIDFFINARTKDMFRFAPRMSVISIQSFEIKHIKNERKEEFPDFDTIVQFIVDNKFYGLVRLLKDEIVVYDYYLFEFAKNDGFENLNDFLAYFNEDFTGKIIHWTDKKY